MKKVLYTVCSANHLAHCKTMLDSFVRFNPGYTIYIGLVDKIDGRFDKKIFKPYYLLEIGELGIEGFDEIVSRYNVIELNCSMKVYVAQFIFNKYEPDILLYMDSDIWVTGSLQPIEEALEKKDILLTPHFTTPFPDRDRLPHERDLLRSGLYNAGFLAFKKSETTALFLQWWERHMRKECYYNFAEGMGVDQNWLNLIPLYFEQVDLFNHKGANVAYWNLHERVLSESDGTVWVNGTEPLLFLHISGYNINTPEVLSKHQNRFILSDLPVLRSLLIEYIRVVKESGFDTFSVMPCLYVKTAKKPTGVMALVNKMLKPIGIRINKL